MSGLITQNSTGPSNIVVSNNYLFNEIKKTIKVEDSRKSTKLDFFLDQPVNILRFLEQKIVIPREIELQYSPCNAKCFSCWREGMRLPNLLSNMKNMKEVVKKIVEAELDGMRAKLAKFVGSTGDSLATKEESVPIRIYLMQMTNLRNLRLNRYRIQSLDYTSKADLYLRP